MTLQELIESLTEMVDDPDIGPEAEVRLMTQENWPFEHVVESITTTYEMDRACDEEEDEPEPDDDDDDEEYEEEEPKPNVVYIVEGSQLGYGRKIAWQMR